MPGRLKPAGQAAPPVEPNVAAAAIPRKPPTKKRVPVVEERPGVSYIRNIRGIQCRFTLEDGKGRRVELNPRGQRGDIERVNDSEKDDPIYMANVGLLFEEVNAKDAQKIIASQQHNASQESHPIFSQLVNAQGKQMKTDSVTIEQSIESQAIVVAKIEEAPSGRFTDGNTQMNRVMGPELTTVPGSAGDPATNLVNSIPSGIDPTEFHEFLQWRQYKQMLEQSNAEEA